MFRQRTREAAALREKDKPNEDQALDEDSNDRRSFEKLEQAVVVRSITLMIFIERNQAVAGGQNIYGQLSIVG